MRPATRSPRHRATRCCKLLAAQLGKLPNRLSVEGHTDSKSLRFVDRLFQLGAIVRSRQRGAQADPTVRRARQPGGRRARLRRSKAAQARGSHQCVQPARVHRGEISDAADPSASPLRPPANQLPLGATPKPAAPAAPFTSRARSAGKAKMTGPINSACDPVWRISWRISDALIKLNLSPVIS